MLGVGLFRFAHPDPQSAVAFLNPVGWHLCGSRNLAFAEGIENALPAPVEAKTVIGAFDGVTLHLALVQRREAMRACIAQGDNLALFRAKQYNVLAEDFPMDWPAIQFAGPTGTVPSVL
ncbi:hypothetical protein QQ987_13965 [Sphingobium baderi]|nr:hypothetical protein [Sphingobium baderi]WRD75875.1 hypothetical protein QQ987_13965 [Sphingobium baderi]